MTDRQDTSTRLGYDIVQKFELSLRIRVTVAPELGSGATCVMLTRLVPPGNADRRPHSFQILQFVALLLVSLLSISTTLAYRLETLG